MVDDVVEQLRGIERFNVVFEQKKTVTFVEVSIKYDALKLPKRALSEEARTYLVRAYEISRDIENRAHIFAKKVRNTKKALAELAEELENILNKSDQIISDFDRYLAEKQGEIKELLKKYREENSKAYKESRELAEIEKEALQNGEFELVSDRRIKEFLRTELGLTNITVIDKSSRHRAVLVADVTYIKYEGWVVNKLYLAGLDDNGESWEVLVANYSYPERLSFVSEIWSVEKAMATVFCVSEDLIKHESTKRQGDILIVDMDAVKLEINHHCGRFSQTLDLLGRVHPDESVDYRYEFSEAEDVEEFEISANHRLVGLATIQGISIEATAVEVYGWDGGRALASKRVVGLQRLYVVEVKDKAKLIHPSHKAVELVKGRYLLVAYPSFFRAD